MTDTWLDHLHHSCRQFAQGLAHLLLPQACHLCAAPLPAGVHFFCDSCHTHLTSDRAEVCPRCAATVGPFAAAGGECRHCRSDRFAFEAVTRLGPYEGLLRDAVLHLKRYQGEGLAELLGELLGDRARERLAAGAVQVVVPVPLHPWRRLQRGYNQSEAVSRGVAARLDVPTHPGGLRRVRNTPSQTRQTPTARRENVRSAFHARAGVPLGSSVLLVDDVMTTGATVHEAARALRAAGAGQVFVAVLARATGEAHQSV